jgi:uncharacterized protein YukE
MSFEGMDIDQLQGLAKQIDSDAQTLYNLVTSLTGVVGTLTFMWNGPVAVTFEQDWQTKNRPGLLGAYNTLTNLHSHLVSNISQQTSASAAEGSWTVGRVVGDAGNVLTALGLIGFAVPGGSVAGKLLEDTPVGKVLGPIGTAVGVYQTEDDMYHADDYLAQGQYVNATNSFVNGVGDGLETAGGQVAEKSPLVGAVIYGSGVDVKLLDEVANEDWAGMPNPLNGDNWKTIYGPELGSMKTGAYWEQVGKTLWGAQ